MRLLHDVKKYSKLRMIFESKDDPFMHQWEGYTPEQRFKPSTLTNASLPSEIRKVMNFGDL